MSSGTPEHQVNLAISLELRDRLEEVGYCVSLTRTRATGLSAGNVARAAFGNERHAALSIRVHADGSEDPARRGSSVIYPEFDPAWTADILPESQRAAELIQAELVSELRTKDQGSAARSDIAGFNWSDVPVVLVEVGFLTNPADDRSLGRPAFRRRAARAIARGVGRYVAPGGSGRPASP